MTEPGTVPERGVIDRSDSGKLSSPDDPNARLDTAGEKGTREAGKLDAPGEAREQGEEPSRESNP